MKKILALLGVIMTISSMISMTGCDGSSSSDKDLFEADAWDYDRDGQLNGDELDDYGDFYQDAYDYAY